MEHAARMLRNPDAARVRSFLSSHLRRETAFTAECFPPDEPGRVLALMHELRSENLKADSQCGRPDAEGAKDTQRMQKDRKNFS